MFLLGFDIHRYWCFCSNLSRDGKNNKTIQSDWKTRRFIYCFSDYFEKGLPREKGYCLVGNSIKNCIGNDVF